MENKTFIEVEYEMNRQVTLWGVQSLPDGTGDDGWDKAILKTTQLRNDSLVNNKKITWADVLEEEFLEVVSEEDVSRLRNELIQLAAVSLSWVRDIDSRNK